MQPFEGIQRGPGSTGTSIVQRDGDWTIERSRKVDLLVLDAQWDVRHHVWDSAIGNWDRGRNLGRPPGAVSWDPVPALTRHIPVGYSTGPHIFVWGGDSRVWLYTYPQPGEPWWTPIYDFRASSAPAAVSSRLGRTGLFAPGQDGAIWTTLRRA